MRWSDEEDAILKRLWPRADITSEMLTSVLCARTKKAIQMRASNLGLKKALNVDINIDALKSLEI